MSHVDIPASSDEASNTPRLFYSTGEKNPNIQKQVEARLQPKPLAEIETDISNKLRKTAKKKTK
jgi:hypothetical protein